MTLRFNPTAAEDVSARTLVLSLMSVPGRRPQSLTYLSRAGGLFGMEPTAIRMAVTRLVKEGLLESVERGVYATGPKAAAFTAEISDWRGAPDRTRPWKGGWIGVITNHLGRTDRKDLRARMRALRLYGFAQAEGGLWVRPDNLRLSLGALRAALIRIGLQEDAMLVIISETAMPAGVNWRNLWSTDDLRATYEGAIAAMQASRQAAASLLPDAAARETLLIGQSVIRTINLDPLLPEDIGDAALFRQMVTEMDAYDLFGKTCWEKIGA
jgi:phenylacetic acid degradation operon negative regulatory protein